MKVMVVSDDLLFAGITTKKISSLGFAAESFSTGTAAFESIKKENYRIVLTGWDIPGMSGRELTENIRKLNRSRYTYIIVCAVDKTADVTVGALEAGADDFLSRPSTRLNSSSRSSTPSDCSTWKTNFATARAPTPRPAWSMPPASVSSTAWLSPRPEGSRGMAA